MGQIRKRGKRTMTLEQRLANIKEIGDRLGRTLDGYYRTTEATDPDFLSFYEKQIEALQSQLDREIAAQLPKRQAAAFMRKQRRVLKGGA